MSRLAAAPLLACVMTLIVSVPVAGQQTADAVTLAEAMSIANVDNPSVKQATNQLALNEPERWSYLFGQLLPRVSANLFSTGYDGNITRRATDDFGNPVSSPISDWVYFSNTRQSLAFTWTVNGPSLFNDRRRRKNTLESREVGVDQARWTLGAQVQRQFFEAQEQMALLEVEEALLDGRRVDYESAQLRFEVADASQVDVLDAEVQVAQQQIAIEQQRGQYDQALLTLRQTLGGADIGTLAEEPLPVFEPRALDADALVRMALDQNPSLRNARVSLEDAQIGVEESGESWWPTLDLSYSLSRFAQDREADAVFDFGYNETDVGQNFRINLSWNAFSNFFGMRQEQAGARVQLANQEIALDEQQLQVEADVRSNLVALQNAWRTLEIAERSAEIAQQSTALARTEYGLGLRTFEELQTTVEQEASSRRQELTSRYAFVDALLALEESVGSVVRPGGQD